MLLTVWVKKDIKTSKCVRSFYGYRALQKVSHFSPDDESAYRREGKRLTESSAVRTAISLNVNKTKRTGLLIHGGEALSIVCWPSFTTCIDDASVCARDPDTVAPFVLLWTIFGPIFPVFNTLTWLSEDLLLWLICLHYTLYILFPLLAQFSYKCFPDVLKSEVAGTKIVHCIL